MSAFAAPGGRASSAPLMGHETEPTVFEMSVPGRSAFQLRTTGIPTVPLGELIPSAHLNADVVDIARSRNATLLRTSLVSRIVSFRLMLVCIHWGHAR